MAGATLRGMCPFFVVSDVGRSIAFYRGRLGFETWHQEPEQRPFFAIVGRDGAMLLVKSGEAEALPNSRRDAEMRWDAYVSVDDPDALASEYAGRGVTFSKLLEDTHEGLRGFEIADPDGYVLFFGRPSEEKNADALRE